MRVAGASFMAVILLLIAFSVVTGREFHLEGDEVIGTINHYVVREGDSLIELARSFGLGFNEITDANPGVDPFVPKTGSTLRLPLSWILPAVHRAEGIVINLAEMRLYCFPSGAPGVVVTFPIGIGDEGSETPVGSYTVTAKQKSPSWIVPMSIRRERPDLPARVPPGPDNPLGSHALRLSGGSILIHGTNKPWGVGRKASHGCIRLYPEDISELFRLTPKGMRVVIMREPVKIGLKGTRVFIEVHGGEEVDYGKEALRLVMIRGLLPRIDPAKFFRALREKSGMPEDISL